MDWTPALAIVGTLGGTALGGYITWKIQERNREYESRTRFHLLRVEVYAEFLGAVNRWHGVAASEDRSDLGDIVRRFLGAFDRLVIVGSHPVVAAAHKLYGLLLKDWESEDHREKRFEEYLAHLLAEIRLELGIDVHKS